MDGDPRDVSDGSDEPKVFRIAQVDSPSGSKMDRRAFVKATAASVGVAAAGGLMAGCKSDDAGEESAPAAEEPIEEEEPEEPVEEEEPFEEEPEEAEDSEDESTTVGGCACDTVCTCEAVCTCQSDCTCDSVSSGSHYWYPS